MRPTGTLVCLLLSALLSRAPLSAQEVSGALPGRVLVGESTAAAGRQLELTGANLQASRRRVSDRTGFYRFLALPPGVLEIVAQEMAEQRIEASDIALDPVRTTAGKSSRAHRT